MTKHFSEPVSRQESFFTISSLRCLWCRLLSRDLIPCRPQIYSLLMGERRIPPIPLIALSKANSRLTLLHLYRKLSILHMLVGPGIWGALLRKKSGIRVRRGALGCSHPSVGCPQPSKFAGKERLGRETYHRTQLITSQEVKKENPDNRPSDGQGQLPEKGLERECIASLA